MATQTTDNHFGFVLTPSEPPPASSMTISSSASLGNGGGASAEGGTENCTVCHANAVVPMGGTENCTVCHTNAVFDPQVGQISLALPDGATPAIQSAVVVTQSGGQTYHYDVSQAALRSLVLTGRVDWYLPPASPKPTSVVVSFRLEGEADDAPTHDVTAL